MYRYILCVGICAVIWIVNGRWIIQAVREHVTSEIYMHIGLGIFFTLLTLELALGTFKFWRQLDILWLTVVGLLLYIPSAYLVIASMHALKHKGKPKTADFTATTAFIDAGIYSLVRQPMTLGMAIWSIALILDFQSVLAVILGVVSVFCFWMSARKESEYDIRKFGNTYKDYMKKVPMWNILKGLRK
ncbi:MAG: isoprenylcysteine carboxylmethyltransferase family protein [Methanophagales archaeon]|nr:isoprenylcysteine carboxylmethyltransferase family protein [Methanophagales archaeon]